MPIWTHYPFRYPWLVHAPFHPLHDKIKQSFNCLAYISSISRTCFKIRYSVKDKIENILSCSVIFIETKEIHGTSHVHRQHRKAALLKSVKSNQWYEKGPGMTSEKAAPLCRLLCPSHLESTPCKLLPGCPIVRLQNLFLQYLQNPWQGLGYWYSGAHANQHCLIVFLYSHITLHPQLSLGLYFILFQPFVEEFTI